MFCVREETVPPAVFEWCGPGTARGGEKSVYGTGAAEPLGAPGVGGGAVSTGGRSRVGGRGLGRGGGVGGGARLRAEPLVAVLVERGAGLGFRRAAQRG